MTIGAMFSDDLVAIWYVAMPREDKQDWMLHIEALADGRFRGTSRFRYYKDDKAFDSKDEKSFDTFTTKPGQSRAEVMQLCRKIAAELTRAAKGELWECVRGKDESTDAFFQRFAKLPFVHVKKITLPKQDKK